MIIKDSYILKDSGPIEIRAYEDATVNLELEKLLPCSNTLLTGRVFYEDFPIANATVKVFDGKFNPLFHTITNEDGIFELKNLIKAGEYKVLASASGYKTSETKYVNVKDTEVSVISFIMEKSSALMNGIVYGKVLESTTNKPIANATLYIKSLEDCNKRIYRTSSNNNGQYLVYDILPYKYSIEVEKWGYISPNPVELVIQKYNSIVLDLNLTNNLKKYKGTISGIITFHKTPVENMAVFLYLLDKQSNEKVVQVQVTNRSGLYLFSEVDRGAYIIRGKLQNGETFEKKVTI